MRTKIGVPRSLFYYKFKPFWDSFFTGLGAEVVVSGPTNKIILDNGVKNCVDEACLPVKLFFGHVLELKDKTDFILVPRFTSISKKEYICPEFGGLPDVIRHSLKGLPPLITTEINLRKSGKGGIDAAIEMAKEIGADRKTAIAAYRQAIEVQKAKGGSFAMDEYYRDTGTGTLRDAERGTLRDTGTGTLRDTERGTLPHKAEDPAGIRGNGPETNEPSLRFGFAGQGRKLQVAVIGHPYNIYDRFISMDLIGKLKKYGVGIKTIEMIHEDEINRQAAYLKKPMFWYHGRTAYGAAVHLASSGEIDGIICVMSFGCGIDSFVNDLIERRIRKEYQIPLIVMTIDEHSGEAGFNTRLEAFIDMLQWRKANENYISTPG